MKQLHLQVVRTADDDGSNSATITANEVVALVQAANDIFAAADVGFVYDPTKDFIHINSTLLNNTLTALEVLDQATKPDQEPATSGVPNFRASMRLAELFLDRIVVFFSRKSGLKFDTSQGHWVLTAGSSHSSAGLGWYVAMLSTASGNVLAHELGHFLQNRHTFGTRPDSVAKAADAIRGYVENEGHPQAEGANVFDGDAVWVTDTPPDPGPNLFKSVHGSACSAQGTVDVSVIFTNGQQRTYKLEPDRTNCMSYFRCTNLANPVGLSAQQAWRVRDTLDIGLRNRLIALRGAKISGELIRQGSDAAGAVSRIATVAVGGARVVTAVRDGSGDLKLTAWDLGVDGKHVQRRGSASAGAVKEVAACYTGLGLVATGVKTASDTLKVILWKVDTAGNITRAGEASAGEIGSVLSLCRVNMEVLATAVKTSSGDMKVIAWHVKAAGEISREASDTAGAVSRIATAESWPLTITDAGQALRSPGQLITGVRDAAGNLKLIQWEIDSEGRTVTRLRDAQAGEVDDVALCALPPRTLISAVRDGSGNLKLISWMLNDNGFPIDRWDSEGAGQVNEIAICPVGIDLVATAVRTASGDLKVVVWRSLAEGAGIVRITDGVAGAATQITMCQAAPGILATAVRDSDGNLKVIAWRLQ